MGVPLLVSSTSGDGKVFFIGTNPPADNNDKLWTKYFKQ